MKEKYIELAKKIKELVDRGIEGEKVSAQNQLNNLMEKFGITEEDLGREHRELFEFKVPLRFTGLFIQVVSSILEDKANVRRLRRYRTYKYVECTIAERIEIEAKFEFYQKVYLNDLEIFELAFYAKHNLFRRTFEKTDDSTVDKEKQKRILAMMDGIDNNPFRKQLK